MKKIIILSLILITNFISGCKVEDKVIATFKHGKVTVNDAKELFTEMQSGNPKLTKIQFNELTDEDKKIIIQEVISRKILDKQAKKAKLHKDKTLNNAIKKFTASLLRTELLKRKVENQISENEILTKYELLLKNLRGKEELRAKHILLKNKKEAERILTDIINKKIPFEEIAEKRSLDTKSALIGGDLGYFIPGNKPTKFEKAVMTMKKGTISKPVKTKLGWHVIKLEDRKPAKAASYKAVKAKLKAALAKNARQEYIADLLNKQEIKMLKK